MEAPLDLAAASWDAGVPVPAGADAAPVPVGFWRRAIALVVDLAAIWFLLRVAAVLIAILTGRDLVARALAYTCSLVIPAAYFALLHGTGGRTLGKMLVGARVATPSGAPVGYRRALARYLASVVALLPLAAGYLMVAARTDKRGLHDFLAGTRVIRSR